ncbi:MAG: bifunctional folylpolyglutamate synthase/dihydrofolate synthase [Candidatus Nanopelagicales bacterium]|jgi:dihydrofolate synthase/folylpolyglutamate synthase|nr:bifunctional folylpolyglutamate synthase/dihydrofolate synthase [Actinomycetota bacterium]
MMVNLDAVSALSNRFPENKINPSLDRILMAMDLMGQPQNNFKTIHIAGTNGKTSTSRMIERLLRSLDLKTGLFISPHLIHPRERIEINGQIISEIRFQEIFDEVNPYIEIIDQKFQDSPMTFFEVLTAMGFLAFSDEPIDVLSLEVGMGGRWDSTNVVTPEVSVITSIGLDHQEFLGSSIKEIANEKAGIIKENIPVVISTQVKDANQVLNEVAANKNSPILRESIEFDVLERTVGIGGQQLNIATPLGTYQDLFLPLYGKFQASNAACALTAVETFLGKKLESELVQEAFAEFKSPARLQIVKRNPTVLIDAAHNISGVQNTLEAILETFKFENKILIIGFMKDKDIDEMLNLLKGFAQDVVVTEANTVRAISSKDLLNKVNSIANFSKEIFEQKNSKNALDLAVEIAKRKSGSSGVIVLGSIALAGEILQHSKSI